MRISRIQIDNFRNFSSLDVNLGRHAVFVGENKIGKSNLLYALRLILDPALPDSMRNLREEDFWDGLIRPLGKEDRIKISVDLTDFEDDQNQLALLAEHLIKPSPMVARLSYVWQPLPTLDDEPKKDADYEFLVYAAMTAGLRDQIGNTPDPMRSRLVSDTSALISTTQSRARRVSACQISVKPFSSAYFAISIS